MAFTTAVYATSDAVVPAATVQCVLLELFFGISALASTGLHLGHSQPSGLFHYLSIPLFIFTNLIIGLLLLRTFLLLLRGNC